jgi:hypothetical protein
VGDRRIGRTPGDRLVLPCGAELVFKRPRYQPISARVPAHPGESIAEISVHLVRPAAQLAVTSDPEGAEVRLRGRTVGHTPTTVTVSRYETVSVEVRAAHFRSWRRRLYVRNAEVAVQADLDGRSGQARRASSAAATRR